MKDYLTVDFVSAAESLFPQRAQLFKDCKVRLVGIRGADDAAGMPNSFATYDDQILVLIEGAEPRAYVASVDPSWYFVQNPIVRDDTGTLRTGQLCTGIHRFTRHLLHGRYPCFGQAEEVHLNRLNRDGTVNHVEYGDFGVCIHSGGTGMNTGRYSLACQILQNPDGYFGNPTWNNFYLPVKEALETWKLDAFPYLLVNAADIIAGDGGAQNAGANRVQAAPTAKPVHSLLSKALSGDANLAKVVSGGAPLAASQPSVLVLGIATVQNALIALGYPIDLGPRGADAGYFGQRTQEALRKFQANVPGLPISGKVDAETLFALDRGILGMERPIQLKPMDTRELTVLLPNTALYSPPPKSAVFLKGIPLASAKPVGAKYLKKFAKQDEGSKDPSRCRTFLQFEDGTLFFDAKMSVDTDGSPNARQIDPNPDDADIHTSWRYPANERESFNAETIPYIVLPEYDKNDQYDFIDDMGLALGALAIVIYRDKMAAAILADEGPTHKIGEGSVRLHELLGVDPWKNGRRGGEILDSSIEDSVLYFVFRTAVGNDLDPENSAETVQKITSRALECYRRLGFTGEI